MEFVSSNPSAAMPVQFIAKPISTHIQNFKANHMA
jgi:hypothetical protein